MARRIYMAFRPPKPPAVRPGPAKYHMQPVSAPRRTFSLKTARPNIGAGIFGTYKPPGSSTSTPAPPAAAAAPPAVSPPDSVMPVDPAYDAQVAALQRQRDTTISGLQSQRTASLLGYGYNEGTGGALSFDPNNAFSKAAQLKKRFDEGRASAGTSMASRGQLYAGAYQQAQDVVNRGQLQSEDALQKQLIAYLAGNTGQQAQAGTNYLTGLADAGAGRLDRLAANPLYTPGTADAGETPAAPAGTAAPSRPAVKGIPAKYLGRLGPFAGVKPPAAPKRSPQPVPAARRPGRRVR